MGNFWFDLVILIILLAFSAFFSASETAITSVSRLKVNRWLEQKLWGAKALHFLKENPARMLSTILIGNNIVNIFASVLAASLAIKIFKPVVAESLDMIVGTVTFVMAFMILVFGEITPKTIAIRNADRISLAVSNLVMVLEFILRPVAALLTFVSRPLIFIFGGQAQTKGPILTEDEIKMILSVGEKEGIIQGDQREMLSSIFDFGETTVKEVMTPGPDMHCIEINRPVDEVINIIMEGGHSRIPVYEGNIDNIVGVVYAKDFINPAADNTTIRQIMHSVIFIPESKKIDELLHQMQSARTHIAIVVDEYGTVAGLVTLEDLIEEIVGEIHDEFEREYKSVDKLDKNTALVDAKMNIADVNLELELTLPEKGADTLAGFVLDQLGKMPAVGDKVVHDNVVVSVERVHKRRITRLKVTKLERTVDSNIVGG